MCFIFRKGDVFQNETSRSGPHENREKVPRFKGSDKGSICQEVEYPGIHWWIAARAPYDQTTEINKNHLFKRFYVNRWIDINIENRYKHCLKCVIK